MTISARNLSQLPSIARLRRWMQSMAMLDAIFCADWELRYWSFNAGWSAGEQMGSMRNGAGDHLFALFNGAGCWIKGFAHEAPLSPWRREGGDVWPGVFDGVPPAFAECLREPAFVADEATFCVWRRLHDRSWRRGRIELPPGSSDPDGSEQLLTPLAGDPESHRAWAEAYFERAIDPVAITDVYKHRPLTAALVARLNPERPLDELESDRAEIGYPT